MCDWLDVDQTLLMTATARSVIVVREQCRERDALATDGAVAGAPSGLTPAHINFKENDMANNLTPFDRFGDLTRFEPLRGLEDFFRDFHLKRALRDFEAAPLIKLDVSETEQAYSVKAELPGMKKEDIKVDIDGNRVSISAEIKRESEKKEGHTVVRSERYVGQQFRSFTLDQDVDDSKAEARYQDGVLELTLPKKPNNASRKIVVN